MKSTCLSLLAFALSYFAFSQNYEPIPCNETIVTDTFFNSYVVEDKYRWMEDYRSPDLVNWVDLQNEQSEKYLRKVVNKTDSYLYIDKYSDVKNDIKSKKGDYYFKLAYYNMNGTPSLFYKRAKDIFGDYYNLLIDFNKLFGKDNYRIKSYHVSHDSKYLAYLYGKNGSDWTEAKVVSLETGRTLDDHIKNIRFNYPVKWFKNGFFYTDFQQDEKMGPAKWQRILYHELGTEQAEDKLIFERKNNPFAELYFDVSADQQYLVIKELNAKQDYYNYFYIDYNTAPGVLKPLLMRTKVFLDVIDSYNGKLIAKTYHNSNSGKIVAFDPKQPTVWNELVPSYDGAVLDKVRVFHKGIITVHISGNHPVLMAHDFEGNVNYKLDLPLGSSLGNFSGDYYDDYLYFDFRAYTIPSVNYKFNLSTYQRELVEKTKVLYDFEKYKTESLECPVDEEKNLSIIMVYDSNLVRNGKNPVILKVYGGFQSINKPSFSPGIIHFIEQGGIFAFASVRGDGSGGLNWYREGTGANKANTVLDYIKAAEYLIDKKYTSPGKIGAYGGSHGGMIASAAFVQRPYLYGALVSLMAPYDMLRSEKYMVGPYHTDEFGTVKDSSAFTQLLKYSPYHNISENINYPPSLIITANNDERVPPFHSYKFAAKLQNRSVQKNPVILLSEEGAGHFGEMKLAGVYQEEAKIFGFFLHTIGQAE